MLFDPRDELSESSKARLFFHTARLGSVRHANELIERAEPSPKPEPSSSLGELLGSCRPLLSEALVKSLLKLGFQLSSAESAQSVVYERTRLRVGVVTLR